MPELNAPSRIFNRKPIWLSNHLFFKPFHSSIEHLSHFHTYSSVNKGTRQNDLPPADKDSSPIRNPTIFCSHPPQTLIIHRLHYLIQNLAPLRKALPTSSKIHTNLYRDRYLTFSIAHLRSPIFLQSPTILPVNNIGNRQNNLFSELN